MNQSGLIIIHLLHNMRIHQSHILNDDFAESLSINISNPNFSQKLESLNYLKDTGYIQIDKDKCIGLTQKGGEW